ncbi:hypothetical protein F4811DRAFT_520847 [Daldinia bambusicola]|nr:hypothetical protein F4811DRAFT_520847 [Daldinia bambusicola]
MTHIPLGQGIHPGSQTKDETGLNHRPDSRRLNTVNNASPFPSLNPRYSNLLLNTLARFEWASQENLNIELPGSRHHAVPDLNWIIDTLQPIAEAEVQTFRILPTLTDGPGPRDHYDDGSVSDARILEPPPPVVLRDREADFAHFAPLLMTTPNDLEVCEIHMPVPKTYNYL